MNRRCALGLCAIALVTIPAFQTAALLKESHSRINWSGRRTFRAQVSVMTAAPCLARACRALLSTPPMAASTS